MRQNREFARGKPLVCCGVVTPPISGYKTADTYKKVSWGGLVGAFQVIETAEATMASAAMLLMEVFRQV